MSIEHSRMKFHLLFLAVALAGCGTKPNPASCADDHCSDPARPFCDEDGSIGGKPDTCIAVECMPGAFEACRGDNALHCSALGNNFEEVQCEEGCSNAAMGCNECADIGTCGPPTHIVPRYLPTVCDELNGGANDLVISTATTIDTSVDATCNGGIIQQVDGPEICVIIRRSITVSAGHTLKITGSRAVALVSDAAITIEGIIDVSADLNVNGPGGGTIHSGTSMISGLEGGGGAGFKSAGGRGGTTTGSVGPDNGGPARPDPSTQTAFIGGAKAGFSYGADGGGGALMLVSCRETVLVLGVIDAGGGGGFGGFTAVDEIPASGGGSGGYVVVQGRMVTLTGQLFANGGGGGAGRRTFSGDSGAAGSDGSRDLVIGGLGGVGVNGGANGGAGASKNGDASIGSNPSAGNGAGGGGGGVGFLQIYAPANVTVMNTANASPAFQPDRPIELK